MLPPAGNIPSLPVAFHGLGRRGDYRNVGCCVSLIRIRVSVLCVLVIRGLWLRFFLER